MTHEDILSKLPRQDGDFDTCFAFSLHKCGSSMMHGMIEAVCRKADVPGVSIPDLMFSHGVPDEQWSGNSDLAPVFTRKILYYGFRDLPPVLMLPTVETRNQRFVLLVRDPRDALVSQYFSFGRKSGSHARPEFNPDALERQLAGIEDKPIDRYVLDMAPELARKLGDYRHGLDFSRGLLRRYEDVYYDKETFLAEIFDHFGIAVPRPIIAEVARVHDVRPAQEDDSKHIRKGTPGDHMEKLQPETIAQLNEVFRDVAAFYGYRL